MNALISVLPDHVANQIAAGEVVQRPASVVKELLENSIDAGAAKITLSLKDAGKTAIVVTDDGSGMNSLDAELCFRRHATSKISSAEDLFNLNTRGFRGEAMASIAAVAHVQLKTNTADTDMGTNLKLEDGKITANLPYPGPAGSIVEVRNLFYNVPARRKFLKNDRIELRHCIDEFHRVALVHADVEWILKHDDKILFHLLPENRRRRISAIFGRKFDEKLVPIKESTDVVRVEGFVLKPEYAKKRRGEQFFFVNDRFVKSPYLHNAIREAFEEVLSAEHHPGYFLFLQVDPNSLDVNIHPTKTEVKFEDERTIYAVLRSAARHAIGQFNVAPAIDFNSELSFSVPPMPKGHIPEEPKIRVNPNFNPFEPNSNISRPQLRTPDEQYERIKNEKKLNTNPELEVGALKESLEDFWTDEDRIDEGKQKGKILAWGNFMVTILGSKLLLIDVKQAQIRVQFDRIWSKLKEASVASQQLLFPVQLNITPSEAFLIEEYAGQFAVAGFDWNVSQDKKSMEITGAPVVLASEKAKEALERFMEELSAMQDVSESKVLKTFALELAIKAASYSLNTEALEVLREQLFSSSNPSFAPNGKKIIIELQQEDLVKYL
jgi:DNA mismatch repair protein MutL